MKTRLLAGATVLVVAVGLLYAGGADMRAVLLGIGFGLGVVAAVAFRPSRQEGS